MAAKSPPAPLLNPVMVAVAKSGPVGTGVAPTVARMETVMSGVVPVQPLQKRPMSALNSSPLTEDVKLCPPQVVAVMPTLLLVTLMLN